MTYDKNFDQVRLDQLAEQHLGSIKMNGRVLFFAAEDENRLELATWQFDQDQQLEVVMDSVFKMQMMELLDILLIYRAQHDQPNVGQGVVHVNGKQMSIEWLPKEYVEALRAQADSVAGTL